MYHGDIRLGDTIDIKFTTRQISGAPATLAGTPVISAYVGNGTTEITAGITLTVDFDARTGLNNVRVVATSGNGYATATNVQLVITTGTVNSVSVVGEVVGTFSIEARSAIMPTVAARTLDVTATGAAGVDWANVETPGSTVALSATTVATATSLTNLPAIPANWLTAAGIAADAITDAKVASDVTIASVTGAVGSIASGGITEASFATTAGSFSPFGVVDQGTMQAGSTSTTAVLRSALNLIDDILIGATLVVTGGTGAGQAREITDWVSTTDTATVDAWTTTPDVTSTYKVFAGAPSSASGLNAIRDKINERTVLRGTVSTGSSTTSITTSALSPATTTADQLKNRVVIFDNATTTAALRGQVAQITASTASATPTLTVSTMVATPASGDLFSVV